MRSRPDQAHVAQEDVVDLRQLIEAEPTQPFPYPRHTGIVRNLDHSVGDIEVSELLQALLSTMNHGSELVHRKQRAVASDSFRPKQRRARRVQPDCGRDHQHRRQRQDADRNPQGDV